MSLDINSFVGDYPFRHLADPSPAALLRAMDRTGIEQAWVSHLSAIFWRDPAQGNPLLYRVAEQHARLAPVPAMHPELPGWAEELREAADRGAPAVRCDPTFYGIHPAGESMHDLARASARAGLPLLLAVRLEDGRQRHPNDHAGTLEPWAVRTLIRSDPGLRLIITHADREFVEQVHFGATPDEARRILWDISWIWGPPEDQLGLLLGTVGADRFAFGTGQPMRLPETTVCKLDLLNLTPDQRMALERGNVEAFLNDD